MLVAAKEIVKNWSTIKKYITKDDIKSYLQFETKIFEICQK